MLMMMMMMMGSGGVARKHVLAGWRLKLAGDNWSLLTAGSTSFWLRSKETSTPPPAHHNEPGSYCYYY